MPNQPAKPCRNRTCSQLTTRKSGHCETCEPGYDRRRGSPKRRGYGARWRKIRAQVIKEEPICRRCRTQNTELVDHIILKQLGGTDGRSNLQGLCGDCHRTKTAQEDGRWTGAPTSRVVLVAGPPGAGKSTFVASQFRNGDLLIDVDRIFTAISGLPVYEKPAALLPFALEARDALLARLAKPSAVARTWVVAPSPSPRERERYQATLGAQVLIIEAPPAECLKRIAADADRAGKVAMWAPIVADWWTVYRRRPTGETVLPWGRIG